MKYKVEVVFDVEFQERCLKHSGEIKAVNFRDETIELIKKWGELMEWYKKLWAARTRLKISSSDAATLVGVHRTSYSRWERGVNIPLPIYRNIIEKIFKDDTIFKEEV